MHITFRSSAAIGQTRRGTSVGRARSVEPWTDAPPRRHRQTETMLRVSQRRVSQRRSPAISSYVSMAAHRAIGDTQQCWRDVRYVNAHRPSSHRRRKTQEHDMKGRRPRRTLPGGGMGSANSAAWRCRYRHFEPVVIGRCAPSPQLPHINLLSPAKSSKICSLSRR